MLNQLLKVSFALLLPCAIFKPSASFAQSAQDSVKTVSTVTIPRGTEVKLSLNEVLKGGSVKVGQPVELTLAEDVVINGVPAITKGKRARGTITEARSSGIVGRKGKLGFSMDYLYINDQKIVKLTSQSNSNLKGATGAVIASAVLLSPLALFVPGKGAKYDKGAIFTAYLDQDVSL